MAEQSGAESHGMRMMFYGGTRRTVHDKRMCGYERGWVSAARAAMVRHMHARQDWDACMALQALSGDTAVPAGDSRAGAI